MGTEHILLALLELENGGGVLSSLGIAKNAAEQTVVAAVDAAHATYDKLTGIARLSGPRRPRASSRDQHRVRRTPRPPRFARTERDHMPRGVPLWGP